MGAHSERSEKSCEEEMESRNATASEVEKEVLVVRQEGQRGGNRGGAGEGGGRPQAVC